MKHTPAPWIILDQHEGEATITTQAREDGSYVEICNVETYFGDEAFNGEQKANARLIAAAPLLLDALLAQEEAERAEAERQAWAEHEDVMRGSEWRAIADRLQSKAMRLNTKALDLRTAALAATKD